MKGKRDPDSVPDEPSIDEPTAAMSEWESSTAAMALDVPSSETTTLASTLADGQARDAESPREPSRGSLVGRYLVLDLLGSGGMGRVYTAYDPDLDRKVALKLLRPTSSHRQRLETRLLQEAKALARLNHPQVVAVFDVGVVADAEQERVFVAMELVEGVDLRGWLQGASRSSEDILNVFLEAGRGLAAAHEAGLVHRDFKPGNVLVGDDGRVRVCDFGLASGSDDSLRLDWEELESAGPEHLEAIASLDPRGVTRTGTVLGTPSYMAPEQREGRVVGAAADQYSFCIALYQALFGKWPEGHPRFGEVMDPERIPEPLAQRLEPVLIRGLQPAPEDRFESMAELLAELERQRRGNQWARLAVAGVLLALVVSAGSYIAFSGAGACSGGESRMTGIWDGPRRAALRKAFMATGSGYAGDATQAVASTLDHYREAWVEMHGETCRATRRGEQSEELLDLRMTCLEQRRSELDALVDVLTQNADEAVRGAAEAAAALPALGRCADTVALLAPLAPPDPQTEQQVAAARSRLARARALSDGGLFDRGLELSRQVVASAEELGYWPLIAEAYFEEGRVQERLEEVDAAIGSLQEALLSAEAGRHDRVAAESFLRLVRLVGYRKVDVEGGQRYADMARSLIQELGERWRLELMLEDHLGLLSYRRGDYEAAAEHHGKALSIIGAETPAHDLARAGTLIRLGNAELAAGRLADAERHVEQAVDLYSGVHGGSHPDVALALERLGGIVSQRGELERALELRRQAAEIVRRGLGDQHPMLADTLQNLGSVLLRLQEPAAARAAFQEAADIYRAQDEVAGPKMAVVAGNLGTAALQEGDYPQALVHFETALSVQTSIHGADHPSTGLARYNLAEALNEMRDFEAALEHHRAVLEIWRRRLGRGHFLIAHGLTGEGRALLGLGRPAEAVKSLEQAAEVWKQADRPDAYAAETAFYLAQGLWQLGQVEQALDMARSALDQLARSPSHGKKAKEVEAWLADRSR